MAEQHKVLLTARGLTRAFTEGGRRRDVLRGVELHIDQGERLALLGRSGCGKSTLLNIIAGIDQPDQGEIVMNGQQLTGLNENRRTLFRRRHIGFIYQFFNLIPTLTVAENIALPLQLNQVASSSIEQQTRAMLHAVELDDRGNDYPDQLSGGEQQRVAVARGLIHRPSLVLADEPTGNLDAESGRKVLDLLTGLAAETGQTVLIVSHSMEVARTADRVIVLDAGKVVDETGNFVW
jgi:putative ABC transport system ATP-binding protein